MNRMKKIILIVLVILLQKENAAQQAMDRIPRSLDEEIMGKAKASFHKISELKKWIINRGRPQAKTAVISHSTLFRWPMRVNSNYDDIPHYYVVSNYMDINRGFPNSRADWNCLNLNYDEHEGNDYSTYPFFWRMKNNNNAFASAGAPGIVIGVRDTVTADNNCQRNDDESNTPNYISILHADSSISRYLHVKTGSARVVENQFVKEGQLLAIIASSGNSSNPHLHFDLKYFRESSGSYDFVEPFIRVNDPANDCNPFTNTTWWKNQPDYITPRLNRITTHSAAPYIWGDFNSTYNSQFCPEFENPRLKNQFNPGDVMNVGVALTHVSKYDAVLLTIYYPNGSVWTNMPRPVPDTRDGEPLSWRKQIFLSQDITLPSNAPSGTYTIKAEFSYRPYDANSPFNPQTSLRYLTTEHYFTVGCISSQTVSGTVNGDGGFIVSDNLNSTQQLVSGKTRYQSANYIQLNPGFTATEGTTFKARIRACNFCD